jgi:hypothetical protein
MSHRIRIGDQAEADWDKFLEPMGRRWSWVPPVLFGLVVIAVLSNDVFIVLRYRDAAAREQAGTALITDHTNNHNQYRYQFAVRGSVYSGWGNPKGSDLRIGKHVAVYYDRDNPRTNALENLSDVADQRLAITEVMIVAGMLLALFVWRVNRSIAKPASTSVPDPGTKPP